MKPLYFLIAFLAAPTPRRDQRGLSQSTEIAILTGVVVGIAITVGAAITVYVNAKLPHP
jgi:hypothetical protein